MALLGQASMQINNSNALKDSMSREELFALVWERPATEVARELGISDVMLGKLCRRLQVPKPPRGYWARVASGKTSRRPPLLAYRAEIEKRLRKQARSTSQVRLSKLQLEFLSICLGELASTGIDTNGCELSHDGIRTVTPELTAQILILLQSRYEKWLADRMTACSMNGALSSLRNLVEKLQPHAKDQLLVFHRQSDDSYSYSNGPLISVRATNDFLARLAHLSRLARDNGLAYVAADMSGLDHAWSVRHIYSPSSHDIAKTELCVSSKEVWVWIDVRNTWSPDRFETARIPLSEICPIDLITPNERRLPAKIRWSGIKPYAERLQVLQEAQAVFDDLVHAAYVMDRAVPDERLALFDRLWFSRDETGPFIGARQAWRRMEADLDRWEQELESETISLCQDVLGIEVGDIVVTESGGKPLRVAVEGMTVYTSETTVNFSLWGRRFRKDGLPGKRSEYISIIVENDLAPKKATGGR